MIHAHPKNQPSKYVKVWQAIRLDDNIVLGENEDLNALMYEVGTVGILFKVKTNQ